MEVPSPFVALPIITSLKNGDLFHSSKPQANHVSLNRLGKRQLRLFLTRKCYNLVRNVASMAGMGSCFEEHQPLGINSKEMKQDNHGNLSYLSSLVRS